MEKQQSLLLHRKCCCCMTENDEIRLKTHVINNEALRHIFQTDQLQLCYICKKVAEHADRFVQNVMKNQPFFDCVKIENESENGLESVQPIYNLSQLISDGLELRGNTELLQAHSLKDCLNNEIGNEDLLVKEELENLNIFNTDLHTEMNENFMINSTSFIEQKDMAKIESNISEPIETEDGEDIEQVQKCGNEIIYELLTRDYDNKSEKTHRESPIEITSDDEVIDTLNKVICQLDDEVDDEFSYPEEESGKDKEAPVEVPKPDVFYVTPEECKKERDIKALNSSYLKAPFKCTYCILGFRMKTSLERHIKKHKDEGEFQCDICKLHYTTSAKLQAHMINHRRRFKCTGCDYTSRSTVETKDHFLKVHCNGAKAYTCPYCKEKSTTYKNHRYHLLKHKTMLKCPYCVGQYRSGTTLNGHMRRKHPEEVGYKPVTPNKNYKCDICGREMTTENGLYKHKKLHEMKEERKQFLCVECNKSFETETGLRCHLKYTKIHAYALICDYCNKEFSSKARLTTHIQCHIGLFKQVQCKICNQGFRDKMGMHTHLRRVHLGFKPPREKFCPICGKGFQDQNQVKNHLRVHTGEKPFSCSKCPARFAQNGALYYHNKLVHLGLRKDGTAKTKTRKRKESF